MYSFFNLGTRRCGQRRVSGCLPPVTRAGTRCTVSRVDCRTGTDVCRNHCPHQDSILKSPRKWQVAIPTALARLTIELKTRNNINLKEIMVLFIFEPFLR